MTPSDLPARVVAHVGVIDDLTPRRAAGGRLVTTFVLVDEHGRRPAVAWSSVILPPGTVVDGTRVRIWVDPLAGPPLTALGVDVLDPESPPALA